LDIVTLLIAIAGVLIGVAGVLLAVRRDRRESKVGVRVDVVVTPPSMGPVLVGVAITNTERRTVTIQSVALHLRRDLASSRFDRWQSRSVRYALPTEFLKPTADPALPHTLEPGSETYAVRASARDVKTRFFPAVPEWAVCEDSYGGRYWGLVPDEVKAAIRAAKRQVQGPVDDYGQPTWIDVEDDVYIAPDQTVGSQT
jgi:hypothetical protein